MQIYTCMYGADRFELKKVRMGHQVRARKGRATCNPEAPPAPGKMDLNLGFRRQSIHWNEL